MQSRIEEQIEKVKSHFKDDRVREAYQALCHLDMASVSPDLEEEEKAQLDEFLGSELVTTLRTDMELLDKYFRVFDDISSWKLIKQKKSMRTWFKKEPGVSSLLIAGECVIDAPVYNPLAIFAEIDLFDKWMPQVDHIALVGRLSKFRRIIHYRFKMPIFFSNRDYVCSVVGNIDKEHKAVVFTMKSIETPEYLGFKIPQPGKAVRVDMKLGALGFEYINDTQCRFRIVLQIDPKIKMIPFSVINFGTKLIIFEFLKILTHMSENYDDVYKQRIKQNTLQIYSEARKRIEDVIGHPLHIPYLDD